MRLIGCDSFQITAGGRCFTCDVGVPMFTPPELQERSLTGVIRSENHDNFGLAVVIFQVLFMGSHPFAGRRPGGGDMPIEQAIKAGEATGEKLWRMPMGASFDKLIDSRFADMKNTGGRHGGSITAAQFLARFVDKTPWAHLDIAGVGMSSPAGDINQSWGSGWGGRLLDRLVRDFYEG